MLHLSQKPRMVHFKLCSLVFGFQIHQCSLQVLYRDHSQSINQSKYFINPTRGNSLDAAVNSTHSKSYHWQQNRIEDKPEIYTSYKNDKNKYIYSQNKVVMKLFFFLNCANQYWTQKDRCKQSNANCFIRCQKQGQLWAAAGGAQKLNSRSEIIIIFFLNYTWRYE